MLQGQKWRFDISNRHLRVKWRPRINPIASTSVACLILKAGLVESGPLDRSSSFEQNWSKVPHMFIHCSRETYEKTRQIVGLGRKIMYNLVRESLGKDSVELFWKTKPFRTSSLNFHNIIQDHIGIARDLIVSLRHCWSWLFIRKW